MKEDITRWSRNTNMFLTELLECRHFCPSEWEEVRQGVGRWEAKIIFEDVIYGDVKDKAPL